MSNKFLDDPTTFNNGNMIGPDGSVSSRVLPNDDAIRDGIRESIVSTVIFSVHSTETDSCFESKNVIYNSCRSQNDD